MFYYGDSHYYCKAPGVDDVFYSGIWDEGGGGCAFFHGDFLCQYVAVPCNPLRVFVPCYGLRSHGGVDWNVCGLDGAGNYFRAAVQEQEVASERVFDG